MYYKKRYHRVLAKKNSKKNYLRCAYQYDENDFVIDRKRPMPGYKHLLNQQDIENFISIIPDWAVLSQGLNAIVLDRGGTDSPVGWYYNGVIAIHAWENEISGEFYNDFVDEHEDILNLLCVDYKRGKTYSEVDFTVDTAKAFQLLHIFLHELGHHADCMSTRSKKEPPRGEDFAEDFANELAEIIFDSYIDLFKL